MVRDLAARYDGRLTIAKLNVDQHPRSAGRYDVLSLPTLILFKGGEPVERIAGSVKARAWSAPSPPTSTPEDRHARHLLQPGHVQPFADMETEVVEEGVTASAATASWWACAWTTRARCCACPRSSRGWGSTRSASGAGCGPTPTSCWGSRAATWGGRPEPREQQGGQQRSR